MGRNTGPSVIPAAASHSLTAATGLRCRKHPLKAAESSVVAW
jgi:hypothetical protein